MRPSTKVAASARRPQFAKLVRGKHMIKFKKHGF